METNPEGTAQTYIFLVDNQDIALNIVMSGYQALCLVQEDDGYYFSADSFIEEMRSIQFTGSCQSAYHYVTACTVKWMNDKLQTFFKDAGLDGKAGWQLFKEKEGADRRGPGRHGAEAGGDDAGVHGRGHLQHRERGGDHRHPQQP